MSGDYPDGSWTLQDARAWLREQRQEGVRCPCCTQLAKIYKRPINAGMAVSIIKMYRSSRLQYQHIPTTVGGKSREEGKLRYWRLIEEELEVRREDGGRAGWWRVTPKGEQWIHNQILVPKYAYIFDARLLELGGPPTSIRTALGTKFNYEELMGPAFLGRDTLFDL